MDAETQLREATSLLRQAQATRDKAIRAAAKAGMKRRDIARIAGTTVQRVHRAIKTGSSKR